MASTTILPDPEQLHLLTVCTDEHAIIVWVTPWAPHACCPLCQQVSSRMHSHYVRQVADLPWQGIAVRLQLSVRRFFCDHAPCTRRIFAERLPSAVAPYAHITQRLAHVLELIGGVVGGEAGARLMTALGMQASPDTLLRLVRQAALSPPPPRVVVVDDFAFRRGMHYGTILLDLERHRVIDLLPDRQAATFATWLRAHPSVAIISRDRGTGYAEGGRLGAPNARQIADRFHIVKNMAACLDRVLMREHRVLQSVARQVHASESVPDLPLAPMIDKPVRPPRQVRETALRRERRQARYDTVVAAHQQGDSLHAIARQQGLARATVRTYIHVAGLPDQATRRQRPYKVDPFVPYLRERWNAGEHNSGQLFRELQTRGYDGSESTLRDYLSHWRSGTRRPGRRFRGEESGHAPPPRQTWTVCQTRWLLMEAIKAPTHHDDAYRCVLLERSSVIHQSQDLVRAFLRMVRERDVDGREPWLVAATTSAIPEFVSFGQGLRRDYAAVAAALSEEWSQGQTEGSVNRLKLIKRSMYGRATFDLLRQRVLYQPTN